MSILGANPSGHDVAHGQADVQALNHLLQITASDKAIIKWKEFSSAAGETIRFVQPSCSSAVLNRVTGGNTSTLYGNLEANGQVYLVNPNGIVIGQHARIDAGAFTASTFDVLDSDFLEGNALRFFGDSKAGVVNLGTIKTSAEDCSLISFQVENDGTIEAAGKVSLIASNKVILKPHDLQRIYIASDQDVSSVDNPYLLAFNQTIEKDALHFAKTEEGVFLTIDEPVATIAGSIKAESVTVLGNYVQVLGSAQIDVSASNGGGEILIGGDFQGKNSALVNAKETYVAKDAILNADALSTGSGGRIILWSEEATGQYGSISAKPTGFVEISSHGFLAAEGLVDTGGGTLLLDPVDVTISSAANSGIGTFPTPNNYVFSASPANISTVAAPTLQSFLAANNVVIATNQAGGGTGNITVSDPVTWSSAFSLTLDTTGTAGVMTINRDIQNSGTGGVILNGGTGAINLSFLGNTTRVSVGSADGPTTVNAPSATLTIQGANAGLNRPAQLGFYTPIGGTSSGPISVTCSQLTIAGSNTFNWGQIGHGQPDAVANTATTSAATITVAVQGDITLFASTNPIASTVYAKIGHGGRSYDTTLPLGSADQAGNITVTSTTGDILLTTGSTSLVSSGACIGHGFATRTGVGVNHPSITGNITVKAPQGDISLIANTTAGTQCVIGHGSIFGMSANDITADIEVSCLGNVTLDSVSPPPGLNHAFIGSVTLGTCTSNTQHVRVTAGNDVLMTPGLRTIIGPFTRPTGFLLADTEVVAGRDVTLSGGVREITIGVQQSGAVPPTISGNTFVAAGRDVVMSRVGADTIGVISAPGDVNVSAGRDILLTGGDNSGTNVSIGTTELAPGVQTTRIYACGNIIATNGVLGSAVLGYDVISTPVGSYNVIVRAGGDLQISTGLTGAASPLSGTILLEADANIGNGELWGYTGTNLTSICGQPFNPLFPITDTNLLPAPINGTSVGCGANGFGAFRVLTAPFSATNNITLNTTTGPITIHSANQRVDGTLQDLGIGTGPPDNLNITTTSGNIEVSGSIPSDGFNNIAINNVAATWTSGTIYVAAANNLDVNDSVVTNGAGSFITLIADTNDTGAGNLTINQNVTTNAGPILLDAGFGAGGGTSAINQTANQISSTGGPITAQAVGNITFNGAATSVTSGIGNISVTSTDGSITANQDVTSTTGNITMTAGIDVNILATGRVVSTAGGNISLTADNNITINADAISISSTTGSISTLAGNDTFVTTNVATAGPILMITGNNMFLLAPTTNITSSASSVDLVVDNDFPAPPGIGPGFFSAVAGSQVNSGSGNNLRIFTARQDLNQIDPAALFNGVSVTAFGVPGTIFNNTAYEQWCTYYPSPFGGTPFTLFYKDCEQIIVQTGNKVVSDMLFNLNVENMWVEELLSPLVPPEVWRFMVIYGPGVNALTHFAGERYWLSRRNIHFIHYPYVYKENKPLAELVPAEAVTKRSAGKKGRI